MSQRSEDPVITTLVFEAVNHAAETIESIQTQLAGIESLGVAIHFNFDYAKEVGNLKGSIAQLKNDPLGNGTKFKIPVWFDYEHNLEVMRVELARYAEDHPLKWYVEMGITDEEAAKFEALVTKLQKKVPSINIRVNERALTALVKTLEGASVAAEGLKQTVSDLEAKVEAVDSSSLTKLATTTDEVAASADRAASSYAEMRKQAQAALAAAQEDAAGLLIGGADRTSRQYRDQITTARTALRQSESFDATMQVAQWDTNEGSISAATRTASKLNEQQTLYNEALGKAVEEQNEINRVRPSTMAALENERNALLKLQAAQDAVLKRFEMMSAAPLGPAVPESLIPFGDRRTAMKSASQEALQAYQGSVYNGASQFEQDRAFDDAVKKRLELERADALAAQAERSLSDAVGQLTGQTKKATSSFADLRKEAQAALATAQSDAAGLLAAGRSPRSNQYRSQITTARDALRQTESYDANMQAAQFATNQGSSLAATRNATRIAEQQDRYNRVLAKAVEEQQFYDQELSKGTATQARLTGVRASTMAALEQERNALVKLQQAQDAVLSRFEAMASAPLGPAVPNAMRPFSEQQDIMRQGSQEALQAYQGAAYSNAPKADQQRALDEAVQKRIALGRADKVAAEAEAAMNAAVEKSAPGLLATASGAEKAGSSFQRMAHYAWFIWNPMVMFPALFAKFAISTAVSFDQSLHHIQAFTDVSNKDLAGLSVEMKTLAVTYGLGLSDIGEALYQLESADIKGADAHVALAASARAAAASNSKLSDVIGASSGVIKAYHLHGQEIVRMMDDMAAGAVHGRLEFSDFAAGLGRVTPLAAQMGVQMKDIGAAIAILTQKGATPADAFVQLRNLLASLNAPVARQITSLRALGLSVEDLSIRSRGLGPVLATVHSALAQGVPSVATIEARTGLSPQAAETFSRQLQTMEQATRKLFGNNQTGQRATLALTASNMADWNKMVDQMSAAPGTIDKAWAKQGGSMETHLKRAKAAVEVLATSIGTDLKPEVNALAEGITKLGGKNTQEIEGLLKMGVELGLLWVLWAKGPALIEAVTVRVGLMGDAWVAASEEAAAAGSTMLGELGSMEAAGKIATLGFGIWAGAAILAFNAGQVAAQGHVAIRKKVEELSDAYGRGAITIEQYKKKVMEVHLANGDAVTAATHQDGMEYAYAQHNQLSRDDWELAVKAKRHYEVAAAIDAHKRKLKELVDLMYNAGNGMLYNPRTGPPFNPIDPNGSRVKASDPTKLASSQFDYGQKTASTDLQQAEQAMAHAMLNGGRGLGGFTDQALLAAKAVKSHADALEASQRIVAVRTGQWDAVMKIDQGHAQTRYDNAQGKLVEAIVHGKPLGPLEDAVVRAQKKLDTWTSAIERSTRAASLHEGHFDAVLKIDQGKAQTRSDDARAHLIEGIVHDKPLGPLLDAATKAKIGVDKWTDASDRADKMILARVERNTKSWDTLTKMIDTVAQDSMGKLEIALFRGKGDPTGRLTEHAARDAERQTKRDRIAEDAQYRVDLKNGNYKGAEDITGTRLQTAVDKALGRLTYDENHPGHGNVAQDKVDLRAANAALARFTKQMDAATAAGKGFAARQSDAADRATKALGGLASAEMTGKGLKAAGEKAVEMAQKSDLFTRAMDKATLYVQKHSSDPSVRLQGRQGEAQTRYDQALAQVTLDIKDHGHATREHTKDLGVATRGLKGFTDAAQKATMLYGTPSEKEKAKGDSLQSTYDNDRATVAKDIREHGHATREDIAALRESKNKLDAFNRSITQSTALDHRRTFSESESKHGTDLTYRENKLAGAIKSGDTDAIGKWNAKLRESALAIARDADIRHQIDEQYLKDQLRLGVAVNGLAGQISLLQQKYDQDLDAYGTLVASGHAGDAYKGHGGLAVDDSGHTVVYTKGQQAFDLLVRDAQKLYAAQEIQREATLRAALATGHFADALTLVFQKTDQDWENAKSKIIGSLFDPTKFGPVTDQDRAGLRTQAGEQERKNLSNDQGERMANDALLDAARSAGDLSRAFDLLSQESSQDLDNAWKSLQEHFLTGDGNLTDLVATWRTAKEQQDRNTQALIDASNAVGDFTQAVDLRSNKAQTDYQNSLDGLTEKIHDHAGWTQADIDAIKAHKAEVDGWTSAKFDASYLAADPGGQMSMLMQAFGHWQSDQETRDASDARVAQAGMKSLADLGAMQVAALNAIATDIQDQTAVISAMSEVSKAVGDGQVQAVNDGSQIMSAQQNLALAELQKLSAKTESETVKAAWDIQIAKDQLKTAQDAAVADRQAALWSRRLAEDNVRSATNKMNWDRQVAAAQRAVAAIQLQLDADDLQTAKDQAKLQADTLVVTADIATNLGSVIDFQSLFQGDLDAIHQDGIQSLADQSRFAQASQTLSQLQAQASISSASDAQQLAIDEAAANASSIEGQLKIAQDKAREAYDQGQESINVQKATLDELKSQDQTAALEAMIAYLEDLVRDSKSAVSKRTNMRGVSTNRQMNTFSGDTAATVSPYRR